MQEKTHPQYTGGQGYRHKGDGNLQHSWICPNIQAVRQLKNRQRDHTIFIHLYPPSERRLALAAAWIRATVIAALGRGKRAAWIPSRFFIVKRMGDIAEKLGEIMVIVLDIDALEQGNGAV